MASNQSKIQDTKQPPTDSNTSNPPSLPPVPPHASEVTSKPLTDSAVGRQMVPDTGQTKSADKVLSTPPTVAKVASNGMQGAETPQEEKKAVKTEIPSLPKIESTPVTDAHQSDTNTRPAQLETKQEPTHVVSKDAQLPVSTIQPIEVETKQESTTVLSKDAQQPVTSTKPIQPEKKQEPTVASSKDAQLPDLTAKPIEVEMKEESTTVVSIEAQQPDKPVQLETKQESTPVVSKDTQLPVSTAKPIEVEMKQESTVVSSKDVQQPDLTAKPIEVEMKQESTAVLHTDAQHTPSTTEPVQPDPSKVVQPVPSEHPPIPTPPTTTITEPPNTTDSVIQTNHPATDIATQITQETTTAVKDSFPISIPVTTDHTRESEQGRSSEIKVAKPEVQSLPAHDVTEMVTEPAPAVPVQESAVLEEMEVTASDAQPDMTSSSSDSLSRAECSTQSSELMHTDGEKADKQQQGVVIQGHRDKQEVVIPEQPTGKQQQEVVIPEIPKQQQDSIVMQEDPIAKQPTVKQQEIIVIQEQIDKKQEVVVQTQPTDKQPEVMEVTVTELPAAPTEAFQPTTKKEKSTDWDEPMSPVCDTELMQTDPATLPVPADPVTPAPLQTPPLDTIVIVDSPKSADSQDHPMEVIDLISDSSFSPVINPAATPPSKRSKVSLSSATDLDSSPTPPVSLMASDIQLLNQLINRCDLLTNFAVQDQKISFSFVYKTVCVDTTLFCLEDDYPQITLTVASKQGEKSDILSKRLPCVAWDVLKDCCDKQGAPVPPLDSLPPSLKELIQSSVVPLQTQISTQSTASQTSNYTGDDEDIEPSDDDDDYNDFDEMDEVTMHSLLEKDIDRVKLKYGKDALETRNYGGIGDIDIDLIIDMNFLEPEIARAWGVKHTVPLTVRLSLSAEHYLDGADIKVEVFQEDKANTKGICKQVEKIVTGFISTNTKAVKHALCNSKVEEAVEAYNTLEQRLADKRKAISKSGKHIPEKKGVIAQLMDKFTREKQVDCDMLVAQLVEMGWETELAVHALGECNMDFERALDYLSDEKIIDSDEENPKSYEKQKSRGAEISDLNWMSDISDTKEAALKSKMSPPLSHGFLCQVIQYILNRISTLNDFCVICDDTHLFSNGAMLKPTVCARELCSFAFQTLGVMADVADSIATGPEVVELLIAMCNAASLSNRRDDILDPYPTVVDPVNPRQFALHPKEKDFKKLEKAMGFVVQELKALPAVLKERLDSLDSTSFPLLQWVLASNRCHIVKLTPDRQIKSMGTSHQFLLLSAPPAKEAAFRKLKQKHKSIYAFHGSRLENWHSIMRNGLMNASGTKFQLHGAAYGAGIYLSPHASVSFGYSGIHGGQPSTSEKKKGRPTMLSSQNLNCIALCEVIDSKIKKSGNIWVLGEADHVVTRFFFVYEDNTSGDTNFDTREEKYIKEIENAVKSLIQS